jgi:hypothetical protein
LAALMEKLVREHGANVFQRASFTVAPWTGKVPTDAEEIAFLPSHRQAALIKGRHITSTQLTKIYLDRIKRFDPTLLCAVTIMEEQALGEAAKMDAELKSGKYRGPLHGIPYGVKDLFATKGVRTTWGSKDFENRVIDEDAEVVRRLRDAGAVLIAKLSTGLFRAGRPVVSRPHEQPVGSAPRLEWLVSRSLIRDRGGLRLVRHRHGDVRLDRLTLTRVRTELAPSDVRPRESPRRNGPRLVAGPCWTDLPHDSGRGDGVQCDSRRRPEGSGHADDAVPFRSEHQAGVGAHRRRSDRAKGIRRFAQVTRCEHS